MYIYVCVSLYTMSYVTCIESILIYGHGERFRQINDKCICCKTLLMVYLHTYTDTHTETYIYIISVCV